MGNFEYVSTNRGIERYHNRKLHVSIDNIETTGPDSPTLLWSLQEAFNFKSELIRVSGEHQWALEALTVSLTVFKIIMQLDTCTPQKFYRCDVECRPSFPR